MDPKDKRNDGGSAQRMKVYNEKPVPLEQVLEIAANFIIAFAAFVVVVLMFASCNGGCCCVTS